MNMEKENIFQIVKSILIDNKDNNLSQNDVLIETEIEKLAISSINFIKFVIEMENKFKVEFNADHFDTLFKSFQSVVDYIYNYNNQQICLK